MNWNISLGIIAGAIHLGAYVIYNKQVYNGGSKPAIASWFIWSVVAIINCVNYVVMSGDLVKGILPLAGTAACVGTFAFWSSKGKMSELDSWNMTTVAAAMFSLLVWTFTKSAMWANMALQICFLIGFIPTFRDTLENPSTTHPLPWLLWGASYIFGIALVLARWQGQWQALVYPSGEFVFHTLVGVFAFRRA